MEPELDDAADDGATAEGDHVWADVCAPALAAAVFEALVAGSLDPLAGAVHDDDEVLPSVA